MSSILGGRIDEIDSLVEKVHRLIEGGSKLDPDMAVGLATTEPMPGIQRKIDQMAAAVDSLDRDIRKLAG